MALIKSQLESICQGNPINEPGGSFESRLPTDITRYATSSAVSSPRATSIAIPVDSSHSVFLKMIQVFRLCLSWCGVSDVLNRLYVAEMTDVNS